MPLAHGVSTGMASGHEIGSARAVLVDPRLEAWGVIIAGRGGTGAAPLRTEVCRRNKFRRVVSLPQCSGASHARRAREHRVNQSSNPMFRTEIWSIPPCACRTRPFESSERETLLYPIDTSRSGVTLLTA